MIGFAQDKPILDTEIAVITDGKDITRGYVNALAGWLESQDEILRYRGGGDLKFYEQVRRDDQVQACLEQRILAHSSQEWEVIPASKAKADQAAADFIKEQVAGIPWDRISQKMHLAIFYGHKEAEAIYTRDGKNVVLDDTRGGLRVKDARRFRYDQEGNLRLVTLQDWQGEIMPPRKFWTLSYGNSHDDDHYGIGLAYWLYYPCLFKRGGVRSWLQYLDKFAQPTIVGKYPAGADKEGRDTLKAAVKAFSSQTGVTIPEGMMLELIEASRSGTADYSQLVAVMNEAISKIVVGQTMTTDNGSSEAQANVHMDVRQDLVKSDADLINESANSQWVKWLVEWNFPDAKPPKLWRKVDVEEDLNARVNRDKTLFDLGWQLTQETFVEVYGDGYEQKPQDPGQQDPLAGLQGVLGGDNSSQDGVSPQSFAEVAPNGVSFDEFIESLEAQFEPIEFAAKQCKKGWPCGGSCISQSKSCKKVLTGQAATYGEWLKKQTQATGVASSGATPAPADPKTKTKAKGKADPPKSASDKAPNQVSRVEKPQLVQEPEDPRSPSLPEGHALGNPAITTEILDKALRDLEDDENRENLGKFRQFIAAKKTKAVFLPNGLIATSKEENAIIKQLDKPTKGGIKMLRYSLLLDKGQGGKTSRFNNHVALRSDPTGISVAGVKNSVVSVLRRTNFFFSWIFGRAGTTAQGLPKRQAALVTYLHEIGHQIHYHAGAPSKPSKAKIITKYSGSNDYEYAAESFVAWVVAPAKFKKADPVGYAFIDKIVSDGIRGNKNELK